MGLSGTGYTFQVELTKAKESQEVDPLPRANQSAALAIKALSTNKGSLFVGFSKEEVEAEGTGYELLAGEALGADLCTTGRLWFNGANAKDKLCILGVTP